MAANAWTGGGVVIRLGVGPLYRSSPPSAIQQTPDRRRVLDWILDAFPGLPVEWHFVGGYQLRNMVRHYPRIACPVDAEWETTGTVASRFFCAPLSPARTHFLSYTDVGFDRKVVQHLAAANDGDAVLAVDGTWRRRYERRRPEEILIAEKVRLDRERVVAAGRNLTAQHAHAEYAGLLRLSPKAMERVLILRDRARDRFSIAGIPELLGTLMEEGLSVRAVGDGGRWAEPNAPQDLARFVLGTKAETPERLRLVVQHCSIGEQVTLTAGAWRSEPESLLDRIQAHFSGREAVVRSSALAEDRWSTAHASAVAGVPVDDRWRPWAVVDRAVASSGDGNPDNRVLAPEMLTGTRDQRRRLHAVPRFRSSLQHRQLPRHHRLRRLDDRQDGPPAQDPRRAPQGPALAAPGPPDALPARSRGPRVHRGHRWSEAHFAEQEQTFRGLVEANRRLARG